jgi:hypothetical protein
MGAIVTDSKPEIRRRVSVQAEGAGVEGELELKVCLNSATEAWKLEIMKSLRRNASRPVGCNCLSVPRTMGAVSEVVSHRKSASIPRLVTTIFLSGQIVEGEKRRFNLSLS